MARWAVAAVTLLTIAADPKYVGAKIGITAVLHTWGSAMTHHPHVHCIVPGGGLAADGSAWIAGKPSFFLPVRVLSKLFRRLMLDKLAVAHAGGKLQFFGAHRSQKRILVRVEPLEWLPIDCTMPDTSQLDWLISITTTSVRC